MDNDSISSSSRNYHYVLMIAPPPLHIVYHSCVYLVYLWTRRLPDHPRTSLSLLTCAVYAFLVPSWDFYLPAAVQTLRQSHTVYTLSYGNN